MSQVQAFKLKKGLLIGLASWLGELVLTGKESRERTKFIRTIVAGYQELEKDRKGILEEAANKDEDGKPVIIKGVDNEVDHFDIPDEKMVEVNKQIVDLFNEDYVLDVVPSNEQNIKLIRDIVLNTDYKFGPREGDTATEATAKMRQANDYDTWCDAFESLKFAD